MPERCRRPRTIAIAFFFMAALGSQAGCASYPANPKLEQYSIEKGYRFNNLEARRDTPKLFVIVAFSGGGTRAAALSYGVLEKLHATDVATGGEVHPLIEEIDVLSSISGGSFTSAYYGLFRDQIFTDYLDGFLYKNIQGQLARALFNPINWVKLLSPTYGRIELASELYDDEVFGGKTFAKLTRQATRPFLMINATDVSQGAQFSFTQAQFDPICSNLDGVNVARAVAASSNFPIAFSPMTIDSYAGTCGYVEPPWVEKGLKDVSSDPPRYQRAQLLRSYLDASDRPFIHLLDGGVSDNIGLRAPMVALTTNDPPWSLKNQLNNKEVDKIVVITVDAKTDPPQTMDRKASSPGLVDIVNAIASIPMENYSADTIKQLQDVFDRKKADGKIAAEFQKLRNPEKRDIKAPTHVDLYNIYVGFDRIEDPERRKYFQSLPTTFKLDKEQVDDLRAIAVELLDQSKDFQKLLSDLNAPN